MSSSRLQIVFKLFSNEPNRRKSQVPAASAEQYQFGPFHLDVTKHELHRDNQVIALTAKTFDLLLILVQAAGRTFSKSEVLASLWPDTVVEESNVTQTIFMLRQVLAVKGDGDDPGYILTVPRRGYKFVGSVSHQNARDGVHTPETATPADVGLSTTSLRPISLVALALFAVSV